MKHKMERSEGQVFFSLKLLEIKFIYVAELSKQ